MERQDITNARKVAFIVTCTIAAVVFTYITTIAVGISGKATLITWGAIASVPALLPILILANATITYCMKQTYKVSLFCTVCQKYRTGKPTHENNYYFNCRKCGDLLTGNVRRPHKHK